MQRRTLKEKRNETRRASVELISHGCQQSLIRNSCVSDWKDRQWSSGSEGRGHVYIRLLLLSFSYAFYLFKHIFLPFWFFPSFLYSLDAVPVDILCLKERRCWSRRIDNENSNYKRELLFFFFLVFIQRRRLLGSTRENMAQHGTELFVSCIHCGRKLHGASFFFKYYSLLLSLYLCPSLFLAGLAYSIPPINILSSQERERTRGGRAQQCVVPHKEDIQNRPHKWRWKFSSVL